jgi:chromosome segregation ATPase
MLTFFRSHWLPITASFAFVLVTLGAAFYFVHTSSQDSRMALAKIGVELKAVSEAAEKSKLQLEQAKLDLSKEKALEAALKSRLAESEKRVTDLQASITTMTETLTKASKTDLHRANSHPGPTAKYKEADIRANREKSQKLQAEISWRDTELRERQKRLDEALAALADERRKRDRIRSEYHWPHNGSQGKDEK